MKRMIGTGLFALLLATMVAPSAKAIRPELLPERVHPTIHTEVVPDQGAQVTKQAEPKVQVSMSDAKMKQPEAQQSSENERPPFSCFEEIYRQRYGD